MIENLFRKKFISVAQEMTSKWEKKDFKIDENNQFALDFFTAYFSSIQELENLGGKPHKGIYIYGNKGTGKSLLFEILEGVYAQTKYPKIRFKSIHTIHLVDSMRSELSQPGRSALNEDSLYSKHSKGTIYFDDLGAEKTIFHFGNQIDVMSDILQLRYTSLKRTPCRTYISSNLSPEEVNERYGERLYDRLFEMFNIIKLEGTSRR